MRRTAYSVLLVLALAGCGADGPAASGEAVRVEAGDTACRLSTGEVAAGNHVFRIENTGSTVTEVYLYGAGDRIVAEKENIGPGITYELTAQVAAGPYEVVCKPGMTGDGLRTPLTVTRAAAAHAGPTRPAAPR